MYCSAPTHFCYILILHIVLLSLMKLEIGSHTVWCWVRQLINAGQSATHKWTFCCIVIYLGDCVWCNYNVYWCIWRLTLHFELYVCSLFVCTGSCDKHVKIINAPNLVTVSFYTFKIDVQTIVYIIWFDDNVYNHDLTSYVWELNYFPTP